MESGLSQEEGPEPKKPKTISETFNEAFPHYLAMGMTEEQFWDRDSTLAISYRKAYKIRQEEINYHAWLNGLYILKALQTPPIFGNGFMPKGARPDKYFDKPIDFTPEKPVRKKVSVNEQKMMDGVAFMTKLAARFNSQNDRKKQEQRLTNPEGKE